VRAVGREVEGGRDRRCLRALLAACLGMTGTIAACEKATLPTQIDRPRSPAGVAKCFIDPECPAGIRNAATDTCADKTDCSELWKCPQGVLDPSACTQGSYDCAYSPGCISVTNQAIQRCDTGICVTSLQACTPRIKIAPYSFTPDPNQCDCKGADPNLDAVQRECGGAPPAPVFLDALVVSASEIDLLWQDRSANEDGFGVERKEGCCSPWTRIALTAANVTRFDDHNLRPCTTYAYRIWAFNEQGESARSQELGRTTLGCRKASNTQRYHR
jgi:hypothetical protein